MSAAIRGPFATVAFIRDYVQGSKEPYLYGTCDGFSVSGLEDDLGSGDSVLLLSEAAMPAKGSESTKQHRLGFLQKLKERYPVLDISYRAV